MNKPEDISQDVWDAARRAALPQYQTDIATSGKMIRGECDAWPIVRVPASAIVAEREATIGLIEAMASELVGDPDEEPDDDRIFAAGILGMLVARLRKRGKD